MDGCTGRCALSVTMAFALDLLYKGIPVQIRKDLVTAFSSWSQQQRLKRRKQLPPQKHVCSSECEWFTFKNVNICQYGNVHFCDVEICDKQEQTGDARVCALTCKLYDMELIDGLDGAIDDDGGHDDHRALMRSFTDHGDDMKMEDTHTDNGATIEDISLNPSAIDANAESAAATITVQEKNRELRKQMKKTRKKQLEEQLQRRELTRPTDLLRTPVSNRDSLYIRHCGDILLSLLRYQREKQDKQERYLNRVHQNEDLISPKLLQRIVQECRWLWHLLTTSPGWRKFCSQYTDVYHPLVVFYRMQRGYAITLNEAVEGSDQMVSKSYGIISRATFLQKALPPLKELRLIPVPVFSTSKKTWEPCMWTKHSKLFQDLIVLFTHEQLLDALHHKNF